jgi:hypothetical protein
VWHTLSAFTITCASSNTLHFIEERLTKSSAADPVFSSYCQQQGNVLPPFEAPHAFEPRYHHLERSRDAQIGPVFNFGNRDRSARHVIIQGDEQQIAIENSVDLPALSCVILSEASTSLQLLRDFLNPMASFLNLRRASQSPSTSLPLCGVLDTHKSHKTHKAGWLE